MSKTPIKIPSKEINELENIFKEATEFVGKHYKTTDTRDFSIKILATMNQIIELKKLNKVE